MGRKKKPPPEVDLICEWNGCQEHKHSNVNAFLTHLRSHCDQAMKDGEQEGVLSCGWFGCDEITFESRRQLQVHVSFHGFHTKLMSFGYVLMKQLSEELGKDISCTLDGTTRTLLPPLPDMFVCCWRDCLAIFHEAEEFYRHVERHPFESEAEHVDAPNQSGKRKNRSSLLSSSATSSSDQIACLWLDCTLGPDSKSHIRDHLRSHTQEKVIACPNCGALFSHKNKFRDHLLRQMDGNDSNPSIALEINEDQEIVNVKILPDTAQVHKCEDCEKTFHSASLLREHNRKHYHYYKCDICGLTTCSASTLKHHKAYRHSDDRPFSCSICPAKFKARSDLRKHAEIHIEDNPFKCNLCDFECRCCHSLANHTKQTHYMSNSDYVCHECERKFTRGNNLTRHLTSMHGYKLKPGQSRFNYVRDDDGVYKLNQL